MLLLASFDFPLELKGDRAFREQALLESCPMFYLTGLHPESKYQ